MTRTAILFDLDGVTVDTEPLYLQAEIRLFKEYGVEIPPEDWELFREDVSELPGFWKMGDTFIG